MECGMPTQRSGGLGIHDLEVKNLALLGKWLFKLLTEDGIWQTLLKRKYIGTTSALGTRRFTFLGRAYGHEEVLLPLWYFFDQGWGIDTFLEGLLVR
jgi:hypothetical protein